MSGEQNTNDDHASVADPNDPTANYRKYAKGPNFLLIVILFAISILVILFLGVLFVKGNARRLNPVHPNPTPNSRLVLPGQQQSGSRLV